MAFFRRFFGSKSQSSGSVSPVTQVSPEIAREYELVVAKFIPYFHSLSQGGKEKFISRAWDFRQNKIFHFVGMTEQAEIPVLISAAAVQLSFGLSDYRLGFFKNIYVMPDAYQFEQAEELYIGHVAPSGIHISWKHLLQGYADSSDNVNVAIHEMAHAIEHHHFLDQADIDWEFRKDFEKLAAVFGPSLANVLVHRRSYLRPYAYLNMQEFWAVSVEAFFENPRGLKDNMPRLYNVIAEILNQDPADMDPIGGKIA